MSTSRLPIGTGGQIWTGLQGGGLLVNKFELVRWGDPMWHIKSGTPPEQTDTTESTTLPITLDAGGKKSNRDYKEFIYWAIDNSSLKSGWFYFRMDPSSPAGFLASLWQKYQLYSQCNASKYLSCSSGVSSLANALKTSAFDPRVLSYLRL